MQLREAGLGDSKLASHRNSLPNLTEKVHRRLSAEAPAHLICDALLLTADCGTEHCEHDRFVNAPEISMSRAVKDNISTQQVSSL